MESKKCTKCKKDHPLGEFIGEKNRIRLMCKKCRETHKNYDKGKRLRNIDYRVTKAKLDADRRGYEWYLSDDYAKYLFTQPCHYCGFLDLEIRCNGIDRMDNSKCYIPYNCVSCCKWCNKLKGTFDYADFITRCKAVIVNCPTQ
jgi:hypothetical protein